MECHFRAYRHLSQGTQAISFVMVRQTSLLFFFYQTEYIDLATSEVQYSLSWRLGDIVLLR